MVNNLVAESAFLRPTTAGETLRMLNLGCGSRFHPEWTNVDVASRSPYVRAHDLRKKIPFSEAIFDVVYHSHFLEHIPKEKAIGFLQECHRVLKPGGIIRVAVPDLEGMVRLYLCALERALEGDKTWRQNYEWMMIELYDQTTRERSGGAMLEYLTQKPIPNLEFVCQRTGAEARSIMKIRTSCSGQLNGNDLPVESFAKRLRQLAAGIRARCLRVALGRNDYLALEMGRFRMSGEVHHWNYDRYSLALVLERSGFCRPRVVGPAESSIPHWPDYNLDTEPDGSVYKPHSLYVEATKPEEA
jgi:predicted SAM-dependent methyltransferase